MTSLSPDALRVLRQIHERGLTVLWSFTVPHPEYGNGEAMTDEDWRTADRELWRTVERHATYDGPVSASIVRDVIRDGFIVREDVRADFAPDGKFINEIVVGSYVRSHAIGTSTSQLEHYATFERPYHHVSTYMAWESEFINRERIDADDWTEEHIGLRSRYTLTDKALALIGAA